MEGHNGIDTIGYEKKHPYLKRSVWLCIQLFIDLRKVQSKMNFKIVFTFFFCILAMVMAKPWIQGPGKLYVTIICSNDDLT